MIIHSLLDNDLYTLTQMQLVFHKHKDVNVRYAFKWRNIDKMRWNNILLDRFFSMVDREVDDFCKLKFKANEIEHLRQSGLFQEDFLEYLTTFQPNRKYVEVLPNKIIIEGPWLETIIFEVPLLSVVSELYTTQLVYHPDKKQHKVFLELEDIIRANTLQKFKTFSDINYLANGFKFAEFGGRRRAFFGAQLKVLATLKDICPDKLMGTSNMLLSMRLGIPMVGTMAHQYLQGYQQLGPIEHFQKAAMKDWLDEYGDKLGVVLTDIIGFRAFLRDFDSYFAKKFAGCRQDSGNPYWWGKKLIAHYKKLGIDPMTKTAIFSDGLTIDEALKLYHTFHNQINVAFGIGTSLTNDCGFTAPQIVIKMTHCNGRPTAKISDSAGKGMCEDDAFLATLKEVIARKGG